MSSASATVADEREFPFSTDEFRFIASLVYDRSGIVLAAHKKDMVYTRLARRLRALRLPSFRDYCALIQGDQGAEETTFLINAITTNLTRFFREGHHFDHLKQTVLRDMAEHPSQNRRLRIWSAGCSSGEEPYSIAVTLADGLPRLAQWDARILATDLDTSMVEKARAGIYPAAALTGVSDQVIARHFEHQRGAEDLPRRVSEALRRLITFKQLNLLGPWPMKGPFDAIFCRNVMIYFDAPTKTELVRRYAELLKPHGWLYIGHSESLLDGQSRFRLKGRTIYQKVA